MEVSFVLSMVISCDTSQSFI